MSDFAIECEGLTRDYGAKRALWNLTLRVPHGSVYALLGRNGCGKTTTIKLLMGLLRPTRGTCRVLGATSDAMPESVRERVGYLVEGHPLPRTWRVRQLERFVRAFTRTWDAAFYARCLDRFEIDASQRVWSLSRGQRGLVALALTAAPNPELLILDDPSIGLDAVVRRTFLESMVELIQREGRTVLFASHHLADVERVADRIGILDNGVLRADCTVETFLARVRRVEFALAGEIGPLPGLLDSKRNGERVAITVADFDDGTCDRLAAMGAADVEAVPLNLEDAFIAYAGRKGG